MTSADYRECNRAKASFDAAYEAPTPHQYLSQMAAIEYCMANQMHPFLAAAVDASLEPDASVRVLDIGCSYGVSAALLKTEYGFGDLVGFYEREASETYADCVRDTRQFLQKRRVRNNVEVVGFDRSAPAVRFAEEAELLDASIARNLEVPGMSLPSEERALVAGCDIVFSAGTIGYVSNRTMGALLDAFGHDSRGALGPIAVMSILQLFDPAPVAETFSRYGFEFEQLPIQVAQRRFVDAAERRHVLETLEHRGLSPDRQSDWMYADVCVAALPAHVAELVDLASEVAEQTAEPELESTPAPGA